MRALLEAATEDINGLLEPTVGMWPLLVTTGKWGLLLPLLDRIALLPLPPPPPPAEGMSTLLPPDMRALLEAAADMREEESMPL